MFRSKTIKCSSQIPSSDVADLINEIDSVAVASPFDERFDRKDDDLILVGKEEEASVIPTKAEDATDYIPCHNDDNDNEQDLSMNVSELSLDDDIAFLDRSIQIHNMSPELVDKSREQDSVAPQEEGAANLLLANVHETPGDSTQRNENDMITDSDEFNPFVNIGNRLLLDAQATPQKTPTTMIATLTKVSTTVMKLLLATMQFFFVCARRHTRLTCLILFMCVLGMYLYETTTQDFQVDSPSVIAENMVDSEETIQVSSFIPLGGYLTWNSTMIEETVPGVIHLKSGLELDSANQQLFALLKVLALCLAAFSVLGIRLTCKTSRENHRAHYEALRLKDLQRELHHRNLCTSGLHSHLVDRLVHHDQGGDAPVAEICHVDLAAVQRHMTVKALKKELAFRGLPRTGLKKDLISKVWIPARIKELEGCKRDELRDVLKRMNLSPSGMKEELIVRLVEAGH
jgi:hypothetical protein